VIPAASRDLRLSHFSPNFDRAGIATDLNVVYRSAGFTMSVSPAVQPSPQDRTYEEAGLQLADVTGARSLESWFYAPPRQGN